MANMSYCRFQNTALDLADCADALEEILHSDPDAEADPELLSYDEFSALVRMLGSIATITELLEDHGIDDLNSNKLREQLKGLLLGKE